tara:strand:+ start:726 stop:2942 length:2217 start_codon:yes stop_codon:yes gene_type:complete
MTIDDTLKQGVEAYKAGKIQMAQQFYAAALKIQPKHPDANHNMGVLAIEIGKVKESLPFFKTALEANATIAQFWLSYMDVLIRLNRKKEAKDVLDQARNKGIEGEDFRCLEHRFDGKQKDIFRISSQEIPLNKSQSLINLYHQGQFQEVLKKANQLQFVFPNSSILYNIMGAVYKNLEQLPQSISSFKRAIMINPDFDDAHNNMGLVLKESGDYKKSIESYQKAIKINPGYAEAHNNMGVALKSIGKLEEAIKSFEQAIKIKPDYLTAYNNMGLALHESGDYKKSIESYQKVIKINPFYAEAYNSMGLALKDIGKLEEAVESFQSAVKIKLHYADAYNNMGNVLKDIGKFEESIKAYKNTTRIEPNYTEAYNNIGVALKARGDLKAAIESYETALSIDPDYTEVHRNLSMIKRYHERDQQFYKMRTMIAEQNINDHQRCNLFFGLGKACEDLGDYANSFFYLKQGNTLRKKLLGYKINKDIRLFDDLKKAYASLKENNLQRIKASKLKPIFILGLPRSGTTLVEQIVSSHSKVTGAGELSHIGFFGGSIAIGASKASSKVLANFRNRYLLELKKRSEGQFFITDKLPQNFMYVGLIYSTFPDAKILHVKRDPSATCWSNYKQYFPVNGIGYCYDLKDLVTYYGLYQDLMEFWQEECGDRIYNLDYDKLTLNQEEETKKLIEYLDLAWEEACLSPQDNNRSVNTASNLQIRKKVYQGSSQQWRKYESFLMGAFDELKNI